jgi:hypothetical protein
MSRRSRSPLAQHALLARLVWSALVLSAVAAPLGAPPARAGSLTLGAVGNFVEPGAGYLPQPGNLPFTLFSGGDSGSLGGFVGSVGAAASGGLSVDLRGVAETIWFPSYSFSYKTANTTTASWSGGLSVGESFFLTGGMTPLGLTKLNVIDPGMSVNVQLLESLHLTAGAKACLGGCAQVSFKVNVENGQTIASLNPAGLGGLNVLGAKVADVLPVSYSTAGNMVKIEASLPNFSKTITNVAPGGAIGFDSTQTIGALKIDVAQILANVLGLPIPLSGSVLGFDYNLFSATVGPTIDLRHSFDMEIAKLETRYLFSSPVQQKLGSGWGPTTTSVSMLAGETVELRAAFPTKTLGVVPSFGLRTQIDVALDVVPTVAYAVRALEISGHGIDFGPVLKKEDYLALGDVEIASASHDRPLWIDGKPFTLTFDPIVLDPSGGLIDVCASAACLSTAFIAAETDTRRGWFRDRIIRVVDPTDPCLLGIAIECVVDEAFLPIPLSYRGPSRTGDGLEFTIDPDLLERLLALDPLVGGDESDEATRRAMLRRLGFDLNDLALPRGIGFGAPVGPIEGDTVIELVATVPWPATAVLLAAGLAGCLLDRRVRRRGSPGPA